MARIVDSELKHQHAIIDSLTGFILMVKWFAICKFSVIIENCVINCCTKMTRQLKQVTIRCVGAHIWLNNQWKRIAVF